MTIEELRVIISAKTEGLQESIKKATGRMQEFKKSSDDADSSMGGSVKGMQKKLESLNSSFEKNQSKITETKNKIKDLQAEQGKKMDFYKDFPTLTGMNKEDSMKQMFKSDSGIQKLQAEIDKLQATMQPFIDKNKQAKEEIDQLSNSIKKASNETSNVSDKIKKATGSTSKFGREITKTGDRARKSTGKVAGFGQSINKTFMGILKRIFVIQLMYKAVGSLVSYMGGALATNKQFAGSLNVIKTNLRVAFQPIYEFILPAINALMRGLATLSSYIASFTSALFGKTYKQSYDAAKGIETAKKEMAGYGGAAKKAGKEAKRALAGFDEVNTLDTKDDSDSGGGSGGGSGDFEMEMPDLSQIDEGPITRLQKLLAEMFKPFKDAWDNEGQNTINAAKYALYSIKDLIQSIGNSFREVWTNGSGQEILESLLRILQLIFNIVGDIAKSFKGAWDSDNNGTKLIQSIFDALQNVLLLIETIGNSFREVWINNGQSQLETVLGILTNIFDLVGSIAEKFKIAWDENDRGTNTIQNISDAFGIVLGLVKSISESLNNVWGEVGQDVANMFVDILESTSALLKEVAEGFRSVWDNGGQHLFESIIKLGAKMSELAGYIYTEFVTPLLGWFVKLISPAIGEVMDWVAKLLDEFTRLIDWLLGDGKPVLDTIAMVLGGMAIALGIVKAAIFAKTTALGLGKGALLLFKGAIAALAGPIGSAVLAVGTIIAIIVGLWKTNEEFRDNVKMIWDQIQKLFEIAMEFIQERITTIYTNILKFWADHGEKIKNITKIVWDVVGSVINATLKIISGVIDIFIGLFTGDWSKMGEGIKKIWDGMWQAINSVVGGAWSILSVAFSALKDSISRWFTGLVGNAKDWGKNLISNFTDGISSTLGKVGDASKKVAGTVKDYLGFASPTKEGPGAQADRWMPNLMNMLADGIEDNVYKVSGAVNVTAESLRGIEPSNGASSIVNQIASIMDGIGINNGSSGDTTIIVKVGDETLTEKVVSNINRQSRISGKTVITV